MQGVIGVQPHVPKSKKLEDFISRWKNKKHQEKTSSDLNVFRLWAYDAAIALAMAVEKVGPLNLSISNIAKNSTSDFESVEVSQNGIHLCQALSSTRFRGLSGNFSFVDGQLQSSAFEIVNVIGHGPRGIGFWTPKHGIVRQLKFDAVNTSYKDYSTSQANLKAIIWPGDILTRRSSKGHVAKSWPLTGGQEGLLAGEDPDSEKVRDDCQTWCDSQLKGYNTVEGELDAALSNQSIVAAFDEIPYLKLFTGKHCSKYTMVAPIHKTGGFGFAFRKGSHLVRDVLTAILHVIEEDKMLEIDKKWLQNNSCPDSTSTVSSNSLGVHSFWGLFLKVGVAASFALIISMAVLAYEHRSFLVHLDLKYLWRKYILKHEDTVTAIDTHQDQACPSSSPLSITPSPPTQYSSAR
ncbi:hypothetical protein HYC85_001512 [Camellia sinensis]|uniref:Receptor ligand binding region domain-containing protein n=1 Tax=Camellia sinensis TaxID=4442 RepID=A0A7J7I5L4_CAMSI|nr:hypothetical protein HYC85_001512 [Camellia sinensis]